MENAARHTAAGVTGLLVLAYVTAVLLRLLPVNYGSPQPGYFSSDEIDAVSRALKMGAGDLMPIHANKPTLYNLTLAGCYGAEYVVKKSFHGISKSDFERAFFVKPFGFYRVARAISVLASAGALGLMLFLLRHHAMPIRLLALLVLGLAPSSVYYGHVAKEDALAALLAFGAFGCAWEAVRGYQRTPGRDGARYWLAASAVAAGLSVSAKYNCYFSVGFPLIACLMMNSLGREKAKSVALVVVLLAIAFVIGTPYAALHPVSFLHKTLGSAVAYQVTGSYNILSYAGNRGPGFAAAILWREFGPGLPVLLAGLACLAWQKAPLRWLLLPPTLLYLVTLLVSNQLDYQYVIVISPMIVCGAACAWSGFRNNATAVSMLQARIAVRAGLMLVCFACAGNLVRVTRRTAEFLGGDTRLVAGKWLQAEAEEGRIAARPLLIASGYYYHYYPALSFDAGTYEDLLEYARAQGSGGGYFRKAAEYAKETDKPRFGARFLDLRTGFHRTRSGSREFEKQPFALDIHDYRDKFSVVILPAQTLGILAQRAPELDALKRFIGQLADLPLIRSFRPIPWKLAGPELRVLHAP